MERKWLRVRWAKGERGQTLVLVGVSMLLLLLIAALAIDVGYWYGQRRHMQNAADAGALAGAWEICFGTPGNAETKAVEYAGLNGADTSLTAAKADTSTGTVVVTATVGWKPFLAGSVAPDLEAAAVAAAQCSEADEGCGMWPVAFDKPSYEEDLGACSGCTAWPEGDEDVAAAQCFTGMPENSGEGRNEGSQFILWADDNTEWDPDKVGQHCRFYSHPKGEVAYKLADVIAGSPMDPGNRGYVTLKLLAGYDVPSDWEYCKEQDTHNCGANALKCWLEHGYIGNISVGSCLASEDGGISSALGPAATKEGDPASIILYDHPGDAPSCVASGNPITCSGNKTYRVAGFGCVRIEHVFDSDNCGAGCPNYTLDDKDSIHFVSRLGGTEPEDIEYTFDCASKDEIPYPDIYPGVPGRDIYGYGCYRHKDGWKCADSEPLDTCTSAPRKGIVVTKLCACPPTDCVSSGGTGQPGAVNAVSLVPVP